MAKKFQGLKRVGSVIVIGGLLFLGYKGLRAYTLRQDIEHLQQTLTQLEQHIQHLLPMVDEIKEFERQHQRIQAKIGRIDQIAAQQQALVHILDDISLGLGDEMWLDTFSQKEDRLVLEGKTLSNAAVADFLRKLDQSPYFSDFDIRRAGPFPLQHPRPFYHCHDLASIYLVDDQDAAPKPGDVHPPDTTNSNVL